MGMSDITATSAARVLLCCDKKAVKFGLPISSSPSNRHLTLTGGWKSHLERFIRGPNDVFILSGVVFLLRGQI